MNGVIHGGWEFVIAAYSISGLVLVLYTTSIFMRLRREKNARLADSHAEGDL